MTDYQNEALKFIEELEQFSLHRQETIEQFYRGLRDVICELKDRLACATAELDPDIAAEIMRLPR